MSIEAVQRLYESAELPTEVKGVVAMCVGLHPPMKQTRVEYRREGNQAYGTTLASICHGKGAVWKRGVTVSAAHPP